MSKKIDVSALLSLISLTLLIQTSSSQSRCNSNVLGKKFVIGFPDNYGSIQSNIELHILLVSFNTELTEVKLSSKFLLNNGTTFGTRVQLQPGGYQRVVIPAELEIVGSVKSYKTIIIESDYKISVYATHLEPYSTDGYLAIPVENLGNQYVVATYQSVGRGWNTLFAIFATVDNTIVTVQLTNEITYEGTNYFRGDTLTLKLNVYEAVQIQSNATSFFDNDLTGSIVNSSKPIAVISGHQCGSSPGSYCDVILEQNIPVNSWGKKHFYSNPPHMSDYSQFRVIAYYDNTVVTLNESDTVVLGPGEVWEDSLYGNGIITTDKPTLLIQILLRFNGGIVDPSLIQVPAESQFTPFLGFTTPTHSGANINGFINFVNIIVKSDERDTIRLNNQQIISNNNTLPSLVSESIITDSNYTLLIVELPRMEALYFITQDRSISSPMSAIVYGYEKDETYGYAAGISLPSSQRLLTLRPFELRQLGGEKLNISLPCETIVDANNGSNIRCKFGVSGMIVEGKQSEDSYDDIECITAPILQVGYLTVYISVDGGTTFPFSGQTYVVGEEILLPYVTIQNTVVDEIDFTSNTMTNLTWDPDVIGNSDQMLNLQLLLVTEPLSTNPVLETTQTLMSGINNSGSVSVNLQNIFSNRKRRDSVNSGRTVGTLIVAVDTFDGYYTGGTNIITLSQNNADASCDDYTKILENSPSNLGKCPCTITQARLDNQFEIDDISRLEYYHNGSSVCYRSVTPSERGSGQQCCYLKNGYLNLADMGAGTADRYSPNYSQQLHILYDVLPWIACCKMSGNCGVYKKNRPTEDCGGYMPPHGANSEGDPHFTTIDGLEYTFNGIGEFTMASSPSYNFTFQARMERYRDTPASVYTAFVVQTQNSSKIQLQRNILNQTLILIDDHSFQLTGGIILRRIARGVTLTIATDLSQVNVQFNNGIGLRVYIFPESMSFLLQLDESLRGSMEGLLGNFNGDTGDDLMLPNGSSIVSNSTLSQIHYQFGLEWMINENSSLFTYQTPFDYNTYSNPSFLPSFTSPNLSEVSPEVRSLCGDSFSCLFDAVTTGMLSFANETLIFTNIVEEIKNKSVVLITCGLPNGSENGVLGAYTFLPGWFISLTCHPGYYPNHTQILYCTKEGNWSGNSSCTFGSSASNLNSLPIMYLTSIVVLLLTLFTL